MIDTISIESPSIDEFTEQFIENFCIRSQAVQVSTGELVYSFTNGSLTGSYDSRISIQIKRERWSIDYNLYCEKGIKVPKKVTCDPYIRVECSVHKAMLGHNVYGGPNCLVTSVKWLINFLENIFENYANTKKLDWFPRLPSFNQWRVNRVDVAEVFDLGSFEAVEEWFRGINFANFPRRSVNKYAMSGLYASGRTTTVKAYHKGIEFAKHDRKRLHRHLGAIEVDKLQNLANKLLRIEVEIKSLKLRNDFGENPLVTEITSDYLSNIYEKEVKKLLRDSAEESKICRTAQAVEKRLYERYNSATAGVLLGTWYRLSTLGEQFVKSQLPKSTFYRHRKLLLDVGISWIGTDVILKEYSMIPYGFTPSLKDSRRLTIVSEKVLQEIRKVS